MANVVKQFRYYGDNEDAAKNQPVGVSGNDFVSGEVFDQAHCFPILQLGIQSLPGTKFRLNNAADPVIIGRTGIYELDLEAETQISRIEFEKSSIVAIANNRNAYLIVDIIYDSSGKGY